MAKFRITFKLKDADHAALSLLFLPVNEIHFVLIQTGIISFSCKKENVTPFLYTVSHYGCSVSRKKYLAYIIFIDSRFKSFKSQIPNPKFRIPRGWFRYLRF
jgi:hypothetical protein